MGSLMKTALKLVVLLVIVFAEEDEVLLRRMERRRRLNWDKFVRSAVGWLHENKLYSGCYSNGHDKQSRDADCADRPDGSNLRCARRGYDGRDYGCQSHHCCCPIGENC